MICFLTSRMDAPETGELNSANQFVDELRRHFPNPCRALDVCSDPDDREKMDYYASVTKNMLEASGFAFERFAVLDGRNEALAEELVRGSNLLILSGGHVPTQNAFFARIGLRQKLQGFSGIVIGISAGSMNAAETVYAQPEEPGEAVDPAYRRYLPGLGITKTCILPHYQMVKNRLLDGKRLFEDITYPDSFRQPFLALCDGSYLLCENGKETVFGEAYCIRNGEISTIMDNYR